MTKAELAAQTRVAAAHVLELMTRLEDALDKPAKDEEYEDDRWVLATQVECIIKAGRHLSWALEADPQPELVYHKLVAAIDRLSRHVP